MADFVHIEMHNDVWQRVSVHREPMIHWFSSDICVTSNTILPFDKWTLFFTIREWTFFAKFQCSGSDIALRHEGLMTDRVALGT